MQPVPESLANFPESIWASSCWEAIIASTWDDLVALTVTCPRHGLCRDSFKLWQQQLSIYCKAKQSWGILSAYQVQVHRQLWRHQQHLPGVCQMDMLASSALSCGFRPWPDQRCPGIRQPASNPSTFLSCKGGNNDKEKFRTKKKCKMRKTCYDLHTNALDITRYPWGPRFGHQCR